MKKVLIIGSGGRVQGAIIPAIFCLRDTHEIVGVYSRSKKTLSLCGGQLEITTTQSLEQFDFNSIDLIMIAVTNLNTASVLQILSKFSTKHITLMIDTPVLPFRHIYSMRLFSNFRRVLASEDTIALPPYLLARSIIDAGKIGDVKSVSFFHSGYKFHALASLKMLVGKSSIVRIRNKKLPEKVVLKTIDFENNAQAFLYEPRNYEKGTFLIEGTRGSIADYDYFGQQNIFKIGYNVKDGVYQGLMLNGEAVMRDGLDQLYERGITDDIHNKSLMNTMKIRALMTLVVSSLDDNSSFQYPATIVLQDALIIWFADQGYYFNFWSQHSRAYP